MRTKGGVKTRKRHKRVLKAARGFYAGRRKYFTAAKETLDRAMAYAFAGRKINKRNYRTLWIARINAGLRPHGISYSRFISALKSLNIELDRRALAKLATDSPSPSSRSSSWRRVKSRSAKTSSKKRLNCCFAACSTKTKTWI